MISVSYPNKPNQDMTKYLNINETTNVLTDKTQQTATNSFKVEQKFSNAASPTTTSLYCPMISSILTPPSSATLTSRIKQENIRYVQTDSPPTPNLAKLNDKYDNVNTETSSASSKYMTPATTPIKTVPNYYQAEVNQSSMETGTARPMNQGHLYHPIIRYHHYPPTVLNQANLPVGNSYPILTNPNGFNKAMVIVNVDWNFSRLFGFMIFVWLMIIFLLKLKGNAQHTSAASNEGPIIDIENQYIHEFISKKDRPTSMSKTNIYIRGLDENTTDMDLHDMCEK